MRASSELAGHLPEDTLREAYAELQAWAVGVECIERALRLLEAL